MDKNKLIPKLRFHEFDDEWKYCKLRDVCRVQDGTHSTPHYVEEGIPFFSVDTIINNVDPKYISKEDHEKLIKRCNPKKGDILLSRITGGILGYPKLVDWDFEFSIYVSLALLSSIKINPKYLNYYIQSSVYRKDFLSKSLLTASPPKINLNDLESTNIKYPKYHEQEKIANFFFSLNNKITLLENKYHLYKNFKKYLIQQIFAGKLRFDFDDEWQEHAFKDLLIEVNEKTTVNNQHEILSSTKEGIFTQKEYFADRNVASKDNTGYKILRKNQIVLSPQNLWMGNINVNTEFDIGIVSPSYKIYETTELIEICYFKHIIKLPRLIYEYKCASEQGASIVRRNLNKQLFDDITITIPPLKEQQKIGNMLTIIEKKIAETKNQIDENIKFKKGLLQQMFVYFRIQFLISVRKSVASNTF